MPKKHDCILEKNPTDKRFRLESQNGIYYWPKAFKCILCGKEYNKFFTTINDKGKIQDGKSDFDN